MRLDFKLDSKRVTDAIKDLGLRAFPEARKATQAIGRELVKRVTKERLSGRPGLIRRSGGMARSVIHKTSGRNISDLRTVAGFLDAHAAKIARVHELGTVGKGGVLPDIVPRRAKLLRWFERVDTAALSSEGGWRFAKRVSIPARLGFRATWRAMDVRQILKEAQRRWAKSR
jgi:hypothetical protein